MPPNHSRAPGYRGCDATNSREHTDPDDSLVDIASTLQHLTRRILVEEQSLDFLVKHLPRVSSVAIQAARTRHQVGGTNQDALMEILLPALEDLDIAPDT